MRALDELEISVHRKLHVDPSHANLFQEEEMIVLGARVHHGGDLCIVRIVFVHARCRARNERCCGDCLSCSRSQREPQKLPAASALRTSLSNARLEFHKLSYLLY